MRLPSVDDTLSGLIEFLRYDLCLFGPSVGCHRVVRVHSTVYSFTSSVESVGWVSSEVY